jgi:hypothetical protein
MAVAHTGGPVTMTGGVAEAEEEHVAASG